MSLRKWFFRNGPGSVGQSAKTTCKAYSDAMNIGNGNTTEERFADILRMKNAAWNFVGIIPFVSDETIISHSHDCLASLAYNIAFVEATALQNVFREISWKKNTDFIKPYLDGLEVIYEVTKDRYPNAVKLDFKEYKESAVRFSELYLSAKLF